MSHFSYIRAHSRSVLTHYRHILRNVNHNIYAIGFGNSIKSNVKAKIKFHKNHKSAWTIRSQLQLLSQLNDHIINHGWDEVKNMMSSTENVKSAKRELEDAHNVELTDLDNIINELAPLATPQDNINNTKRYKTEMNILSDYCQAKQRRQLLPTGILKKYRRSLLLPIALHQYGLRQVRKVGRQLAKGPPPTYLSYTMKGKSKIWFVRSAVNKHKRQSAQLGRLIRDTRDQHQLGIDAIESCHQFYGPWALEEAKWEEALQNGSAMPPNDHNITLERFMKLKTIRDVSPYVIEWLEPLKDVIKSIDRASNETASRFEDFKKERLVDGGQYEYYKKESEKMYWKKKERFEKMIKEYVPTTNPFYHNNKRNLINLLEDFHFISFE